MNHGPFGPPPASSFGPSFGVPMNPPPPGAVGTAGFDPRMHGTMSMFRLIGWIKSLANDPTNAHTAQNAFFDALVADRVSQGAVDQLFEAAKAATHAAQLAKSSSAATCGLPGELSADEGIDWYEPDPNRFYALDQRSGRQLKNLVDDLRNTGRYLKRGAKPPTKSLFIGQPGNGKTSGGIYLATELGVTLALVRIDGTIGKSVGETAKRLRLYFEEAQDRGAAVFIDEFEAIAVPRNNDSPNVGQWSRETTSALLQLIDSLKPDQILMGATNHLNLVDSAVRSRMRKHIYFYPPDRDTRAAMISRWWRLAPHESDAKKRLLDLSEGCSGRLLEAVSEAANMAAARRLETAKINIADVEQAWSDATAADVVAGVGIQTEAIPELPIATSAVEP